MTTKLANTHTPIVPDYWAKACSYISKRDRIMKRLIAKYPKACLESRGNPFVTLVRSIVGQQISVKAAQSIWDRLVTHCDIKDEALEPGHILQHDLQALKTVGLSTRKAEYILDLSQHFAEGKIDPALWHGMEDEQVIEQLTTVRGIGRWTAEMFLIFHMFRPDIFPLDDVGLIKGISQAYFSGEPVSRSEARDLGEAWAPYRTVATWYIWRSLDPLPVAY